MYGVLPGTWYLAPGSKNSSPRGVAGPTPMPLNVMVGKEILFVGSQRFDREFADAVALIGAGEIDPRPMITATYPADQALAAFDAARDRSRSVKVQISFAGA